MVSRSRRGFTVLEIVVGLAILGLLIIVLVVSQHENSTFEKNNRIDLFTMPDKSLVLARVRHDVYDAVDIPQVVGDYRLSDETLLVTVSDHDTKERKNIVYDFQEIGKVKRLEFDSSGEQISSWETNTTPKFTVNVVLIGERYGFRLRAYSDRGALVVDQLMAPRANDGF